jgi:ABC-type phosphate/phosphonate transport system substrate-binding protein
MILAVGVAAAALPVLAGGGDLLLCLPGFPGTTQQAQPYIDKMLRHLEGKLGAAAGSMSGVFLPDGEEAVAQLSQVKPGLALVGPSVLAGNHERLGMKVIGKLIINGKEQETYSVVTARTGPSDVAELEGKKVSGTVVHDDRYVSNVLLDRKVPPGSMKLESQKRPLKSLRDVARGLTDAAIVDQSVVDHMAELEFAGDLRVIYTSKPVPAPAIVIIGDGPEAGAKKIKDVLIGMCERPDGKELCKTLMITAIKAASDADYKALFGTYDR